MSQKEATSCTEDSSAKCAATAGCASKKADGISDVLVSDPKNSMVKQHKVSRNFQKHLKSVPPNLVKLLDNGKVTLGSAGLEAVTAAYEVFKKDPTGESNKVWFASHNLLVVFRKKED